MDSEPDPQLDLEANAELAASFDLAQLSPAFFDDPYPTYDALRAFAPLHRNADGSVFLTRYADVAAVYRSRAVSSDKRVMFRPTLGNGPIYEHHTTSLVFNDPPYHTRVRQPIQGALISRVLKSLAPGLQQLVEDLLDRAVAKGQFDLISDFAAAIPIEVIGNLLGVPHADRGPLRSWSLAILGALEPRISDSVRAAANKSVTEFGAYLEQLIEDRRANLVLDGTDALSLMIAGESDGRRLSQRELIHNAIFLLNAGHETTTNLIGNAVAALLEHPAELAKLRDDPALIDSAIEEFLRFESSNQLGNRIVTEPIELSGALLPADTSVVLCIGAANRDPAQFPDPHRLDIARSPNRHLAFGLGIHACAGMNLARMEGRIAIGRLLQRIPNLRRDGPYQRGGRARFRGFLSYPVAAE